MQLQNHWQSMRRKSSVASSGIFEMKPQRQEQIHFILSKIMMNQKQN